MSWFTGDKKKVLLALSDGVLLKALSHNIKECVKNTVTYSAGDGMTALTKIENDPPVVVIAEVDLPKLTGLQLTEKILHDKMATNTAIILIGSPPQDEWCLDEIVTGRLQFIDPGQLKESFLKTLVKGINYSLHLHPAEFYLRLLSKGDVLMSEGDKADFIYFVKYGQLQAFRGPIGKEQVLGQISVGEFVGEMAYINCEPRVASVVALSECELIEVPIGTFERVLYQRPAWSRALIQTLSRRVKLNIEKKAAANGP